MRLLIKKKYTNLSGGHWITVTKEGSPLHGKHLYIDDNGTILAGKVPKEFHGKSLEEVHQIHHLGDAPYKHLVTTHEKAANASHEELHQLINEADNTINSKSVGHLIAPKQKEIYQHYLKAKGGVVPKDENAVIKRPIPEKAPHTSKKPIHNTYSKKSPKELKAIIAAAKANLASGKGNAYDKKVIAVASYYLNGGQMPDDSAFGSKKTKEPKEKTSKQKEEPKEQIPHPDQKVLHDEYSSQTKSQLESQQEEALGALENDAITGESHDSLIQQSLDVINHYLKQKGGEPKEFDKEKFDKIWEDAPHKSEHSFHNSLSTNTKEELANKQKYAIESLTEDAQKGNHPDDYMKKYLDIVNHYLKLKGGEAKEFDAEKFKPKYSGPHQDTNPGYHQSYVNASKDDLEKAQQKVLKYMANPTGLANVDKATKNELDVINHYLEQKGGTTKQFDPAEFAPHKEKYPGTFNDVSSGDHDKIKARQKSFVDQMNMHIKNQNKEYYDVAKEKLELTNYYAKQNGLATVEAPEFKEPIPHEDMKDYHTAASSVGLNTLESTQDQMIDLLDSDNMSQSDKIKIKKELEIVQHYIKQKGGTIVHPSAEQQTNTEKAIDDFNNLNHQVKMADYEHTGKNVKDFGVNYKNPDHVYDWNKPIIHDSYGTSFETIKKTAKKLDKMIQNGDEHTGPTHGNAVTAKKKVQKNLAETLMHDDDFLSFAQYLKDAHGFEYGDVSGSLDLKNAQSRKEYAEGAVAKLISKWAGTSADHDTLSIAAQLAAKAEFGLKSAWSDYHESTVKQANEDILSNPVYNRGIRAFLREQYNQTQDFFKKNGITHVPIVRGQAFESSKPIAHIPEKQATRARVAMQPISSFSSNHAMAHSFCGNKGTSSGSHKLMISAMIPVERIIGCPQTGYGCMNEYEFVVLGGTDKQDDVIAYRWTGGMHSHGSDFDTNSSMFKYMEQLGKPAEKAQSDSAAPSFGQSQEEKSKEKISMSPATEKKGPQTKKATKTYHIKSAYSGYIPSDNAKHVPNKHGIDAFIHKSYGGYQVFDGETGIAISKKHKTQKSALAAAHWVMDNQGESLKQKLSAYPKVEDEMKKSLIKNATDEVINIDEELHNADWTKRSWDADVPKPGTSEFKQYVKSFGGMEHFKTLPIYQHYLKQKNMKKSEDDSYYPSDRYAYRTHTRNPIYVPVNRLKTIYQTDEAIDESKVRENMRKMRTGEALSPVVIGYDHDVHDGHHRLEAAKRVGYSHVPCVVRGRNPRRTIAAEKRYRSVWKSFISGGKLLFKRDNGGE